DYSRGIVPRLHGFDLVQIDELLARLAIAREFEGFLFLGRGRFHVAFAKRDRRVERVEALAPRLQDWVVAIPHPMSGLPFRMILPVAQDRCRVHEHRLPVAELHDRDLLVRGSKLRIPDWLEISWCHEARAALVHGIDDRAVRATLAVAGRAVLPAVVQSEVRRDADGAGAGGDQLVEEGDA